MSQTKIIALVVGLLVVAGGGYMLLNKSDSANEEMSVDSSNTPQESGKKMAFSQFIKQGGSHKCSVHQSVNGTDVVGTTYISDGKIKGEYNTQAQGMSIDSYFLVRDGYTYSWTSLAPNMGFKAKVVESTPSGSGETSGNYSFNADVIGDYECQSWSGDASMFALPSGVTFNEIN